MMENPIEREQPDIVDSTVIETGSLYAQYVHGKDVPMWLHQMLAHVQQQTGNCQLPVLVVPVCGRDNSLVVMTLRDFLLWSHRCAAFNVSAAESSPYPSEEE
jgi:hypothetical protein